MKSIKSESAVKLGIAVVVLVILGALSYSIFFSRVQTNAELEQFVVSIGENRIQIANSLKSQGFIKSAAAFDAVSIFFGKINPGGYKISKSENVWQIAVALSRNPYMKWVVIPEGLRKEETAGILSKTLGWNDAGKKNL